MPSGAKPFTPKTVGKVPGVLDDPETIDKYIKLKISAAPSKGGKSQAAAKWTDEENELRDSVIIGYLVDNMMSNEKVAQQISARWGMSVATGRDWVAASRKRFCERQGKENKEEIRRVFIERVESLIEDAKENGRNENIRQALELYGKTFGLLSDKKDINLSGDTTIKFEFS